jgi:hypothetical protein
VATIETARKSQPVAINHDRTADWLVRDLAMVIAADAVACLIGLRRNRF